MRPLAAIIDAVSELRPGGHGPDSDLFDDVGLDSLDYATVVVRVEEQLGVSLEENAIDWSSVRTIGELAAAFDRHATPRA